jgi:hypothetical protein
LRTRLVACYPFDGNADDASGNGYNGTVLGATLSSDRFSVAGRAYSFSGANSIQLPVNINSTILPQLTISTWVNPGQQSSTHLDRHMVWSHDNNGYDRSLQVEWGNWSVYTGGDTYWPTGVAADTGSWQHIAVVYSTSNVALFKNGTRYLFGAAPLPDSGETFISVGKHPSGLYYESFWGSVDDIRIYNRALSASEVVQLFNLEKGTRGPWIITQPAGQSAQAGANVALNVAASGTPILNYQWRFNGANIPAATSQTLTLTSVGAGNSGAYSVVVWNAYGSATSAGASLAVLTEGANGTQAAQPVCPAAPSPSSQDGLVVVTHGFLFTLSPTEPVPMPAWVTTLANCIQANAPSWSVTALDWSSSASGIYPEVALTAGNNVGSLYGRQVAQKHWQRVHLIGHSAGGAVIQAIVDQLRSSGSPPVIQMTFLDPYLGIFHEERGIYGQNANWADCYFTQDRTGGFTSGNVSHTYNVDVDWADPNRQLVPYGSSQVAFSTHEYSHDSYIKSVTNIDPEWCGKDYGFRLSTEGGGEANQGSHPIGNGDNPKVLCGPSGAVSQFTPNLPSTAISVSLRNAAHAVSQFGATVIDDAGVWLSSVSSHLTPKDDGPGSATNGPVWLAVGLTITNTVNFVQFDAGFTDTNSAEGRLTVFWNTNQMGMVDERVALPALRTYRFALPGTVTSGLFTLSLRLDAFNNTASSATVTNVATGFVGITQPISLDMLLMGSNSTPVLKLTAAPGYNYLVQSSTNLVDWFPTALLVNTNGAVLFPDPAVTNRGQRFYRALMP